MIVKKSDRTTFWQRPTRINETADDMRGALNIVQRFGSDIHEGGIDGFVLRKRKCVEGDPGCTVRDGVCMFLGTVTKRAESRISGAS